MKVVFTLVLATIVGGAISFTLRKLDRIDSPAGFRRGLIHGALMPMSFPNLLVGDNVPIYAVPNTGRTYKIGYALGTNGCGLIFFSLLFFRLKRIRRDFSRKD